METKFNVSKETLTQMIENYEYRIDSLQRKIKQLEEIVKHYGYE